MTHIRKVLVVIAAALAFIAAPAVADKPEIYVKSSLFGSWEHALDGYDAVSYHTLGRPVKGDPKYSYDFKHATFVFANQENLDLFKANPDKYRPAYGGHCAWALANGNGLQHGDPEVWHIHEGKLYFNLNRGIQKKWLPNKEADIIKANALWPDILKD